MNEQVDFLLQNMSPEALQSAIAALLGSLPPENQPQIEKLLEQCHARFPEGSPAPQPQGMSASPYGAQPQGMSAPPNGQMPEQGAQINYIKCVIPLGKLVKEGEIRMPGVVIENGIPHHIHTYIEDGKIICADDLIDTRLCATCLHLIHVSSYHQTSKGQWVCTQCGEEDIYKEWNVKPGFDGNNKSTQTGQLAGLLTKGR